MWANRCFDKDFAIISYLISHLLAQHIIYLELTTTCNPQSLIYSFCIKFHNFLTENILTVCHIYRKRLVFCRTHTTIIKANLLTCRKQEYSCTKVCDICYR